jgi:hypothetical protein
MDFETSKNGMSTFIKELARNKHDAELNDIHRNSDEYKWNTINDLQDKGTTNVAAKVFTTIYKDALPFDDSHKALYSKSLDQKVLSCMGKTSSEDIYLALKDAGRKGSAPARVICESAEKVVKNFCEKLYAEDVSIDDVENTDMSPESTNVAVMADKITSDMNADQVSAMIAENVKNAITNEMAVSKEEDDKLAALEASLANDEKVVNEEAVEIALIGAGFTPGEIYQPELFTGIMTGEMNKIINESWNDDQKQKKAFYESVKEMTALQTLQTFGLININANNVDRIAREYASKK